MPDQIAENANCSPDPVTVLPVDIDEARDFFGFDKDDPDSADYSEVKALAKLLVSTRLAAAQAERAAVVAWLNDPERCPFGKSPKFYADAIEALAHKESGE